MSELTVRRLRLRVRLAGNDEWSRTECSELTLVVALLWLVKEPRVGVWKESSFSKVLGHIF